MKQMKVPQGTLTLGVRPLSVGSKKGIYVAFQMRELSGKEEECGVLLFDKKSGQCLKKHVIPAENRIGNVMYDMIKDVDHTKISYLFFQSEQIWTDKYAKAYHVTGKYGEVKAAEDYKACMLTHEYDWEGTVKPGIPYEDCIMYCLHVRGFTKHVSSAVRAKGTFAGIVEKIPYLKELGVTTIELQPCYEFDEMEGAGVSRDKSYLNYWGYKEGYYYAPKSAYAYKKDAVKEFKDLVKECHRNGLEVIMQFYFPDEVSRAEIPPILRYWTLYYQVDGFHLKGRDLPVKDFAFDPYLAEVKLMYYDFPVHAIYSGTKVPVFKRLAAYNDSFMIVMRRYLKSDEGMIEDVMYKIRFNPEYIGVINYFTNYFGLTMMDMVSYNQKHNKGNGENGRDGNDYNFSWNCGTEGKTKRSAVLALRNKQLRNAFVMLLLAQGTPLFFMGDEFGNSQKGNNNPYCQDNSTAWLNWNDFKKNTKMYSFVKHMIELRKKHKIFHLCKECTLTDYKSCGYPDVSYHNDQAWKPAIGADSRHIAFMLCGEYADGCEGNFWYVAMNMHWETQEFAMPKLPKGMKWEEYLATEEATENQNPVSDMTGDSEKNLSVTVPPRSITIYLGKR